MNLDFGAQLTPRKDVVTLIVISPGLWPDTDRKRGQMAHLIPTPTPPPICTKDRSPGHICQYLST